MTQAELATKIQKRIQDIPASHGGYIQVAPTTLSSVLDRRLLERICDEAAAEALAAMNKVDT